jgi:hypothetical protein
MKQLKHIVFLFVILSLTTGVSTLASMQQPEDEWYREVGRTTEREVNVVLTSAFGNIVVSKGEAEKILVAGSRREGDQGMVSINYSIRNRVGYAEISLGHPDESSSRKKVHKVHNLEGGRWFVRLSDAIPVSFDIELGLGRGDFDLSGLKVKDFNLSTGASDVRLTFDEPNTSSIDMISIEAGVSKFAGHSLGNANFKRFRFQGGVGSCVLDFSGELKREVDVDVEVGLGLMTIIVPDNVGAKVFADKNWLSRFSTDRAFQPDGDNQYVTENYNSAEGKMNIRVTSGVGTVRVRRP